MKIFLRTTLKVLETYFLYYGLPSFISLGLIPRNKIIHKDKYHYTFAVFSILFPTATGSISRLEVVCNFINFSATSADLGFSV